MRLRFPADEAETYEGLFEEGNLYELHPDFEKKNDRLTLKMYARLEDEDDMDQYTISGNEEIIFLMTNSSSKEQHRTDSGGWKSQCMDDGCAIW